MDAHFVVHIVHFVVVVVVIVDLVVVVDLVLVGFGGVFARVSQLPLLHS